MEHEPIESLIWPGLSFDKLVRIIGEQAATTTFEVSQVRRWRAKREADVEHPTLDAGAMAGFVNGLPALGWSAIMRDGAANVHIGQQFTALDLAYRGLSDDTFQLFGARQEGPHSAGNNFFTISADQSSVLH
jgi:hypothetical protein